MRWLVTGAGGMVGRDLHAELRRRDADTIALGRHELDITDRDSVLYIMKNVRPDAIVNCAAYTRVDDCETEEEAAMRINGEAVGHLAEGANRWNAVLTQISTDFVFDGEADRPYHPDSPTAPVSAYGRTKLEGERQAARAAKHLVVRTSWLFGLGGWNFVEAIRKQIVGGNRHLRVVDDQRGRPTYTPHLARALVELTLAAAERPEARGIVHYADASECSWYDFAVEIASMVALREGVELPRIDAVSTDEFPRPARRPAYSVLSTDRYEQIVGREPESWSEGLADYFERRPAS